MASESNADGAGCYNCVKFFCVPAFSLSPSLARLCSSYPSNKEPYARIRKICRTTQRFCLGTTAADSFARHAHFSHVQASVHPTIPRQGHQTCVQRSHEGQGDVSQFGALMASSLLKLDATCAATTWMKQRRPRPNYSTRERRI